MKKKENSSKTNNKTRVAIVCSNMGVGGGETIAARLCTYINSDKFEVKLFFVGEYEDNQIASILKENNVQYFCVGAKSGFTFKHYKIFSKAMKEFKPDVVHAHLDVTYSWVWTLLHRKPLIFTLHSNPFRWKDKRVQFLMKLKALQGKLKVIGCAKIIAEYAKECYKISDKKVGYIYNPIETEKYQEGAKFDRVVKFVHVGRFNKVKNHKLLVSAFAELEKRHSNVQLSLAGDGTLFEEIQDFAKEKKCKNINFLGNVSDILGLLKNSDVLVLSSDSEACPVVILEAMSAGLPIIATNVGGVPELVTDNGFVVEKGNAKAFTDAMAKMVEDIESAKIMGKKSLEYAKQYDKDVVTRQYEQEYLKFIKVEK